MTNTGLRIVVGGDFHHGLTGPAKIRQVMHAMCAAQPNVIIMTGDASGDVNGADGVVWEAYRLRKIVGDDIPILYVLGNHDWWVADRDMPHFNKNLARIQAAFKRHNIHSLDFDGPLLIQGIAFVGAGGWYQHPSPPTNDRNFLPKECTNANMLAIATERLSSNLVILDSMMASPCLVQEVVFVSHFGVVDTGSDWKELFSEFNWSESIGRLMRDNYGCKTFICGHSHQRLEGVDGVWNAGSDYYWPKFIVVEVSGGNN